MEESTLVVDIALALATALIGGIVAQRLKQPPILGYLVGGVAIGPFGLGLVRDQTQINTLATIGVALLMFALGVELSLGELKKTGKIALWGGIIQILATAGLGTVVGKLLGWTLTEAIYLGFLISLSSTMILLKTLADRGELDSLHGRVMLGLLIIQDISVVPMMVILPSLGSPGSELVSSLGLAVVKAVVFLAAVLLVGVYLVPRFLWRVAAMRSRELFLLSVVALCLGMAYGTSQFGLSIAFGAFIAGLIISESDFAHQTLAQVIPLRDIFATLFFVSIGMLTDPRFILINLPSVSLILAAIVLGKFIISFAIAWFFGYTGRTALFVGMGMIQVGEFSFVLARVGVDSGVIGTNVYDSILASAFITILLTPFALNLASFLHNRLSGITILRTLFVGRGKTILGERGLHLSNHVVICGHGRVGQHLVKILERRELPCVVVEFDPRLITKLRAKDIPCIYGDASNPEVLAQASLDKAKVLVITVPDAMATELAIRYAREVNPKLDIVARVISETHRDLICSLGTSEIVLPEFEAGLEIIRHTLHRFGVSSFEIQYILSSLRQEGQP